MRTTARNILPALVLAIACWPMETRAQEPSLKVTVFNDDLGLIRARRTLALEKGLQTVRITDIPTGLDPTSVHFEAIPNAEDVKVLEQNFQYDLLDNMQLLRRYVGHTISVTDDEGTLHEGVLQRGVDTYTRSEWDPALGRDVERTSFREQHLVLADDPQRGPFVTLRLDKITRIGYPELATGLVAKPTLTWEVQARRAGKQDCDISYMTAGMNWHADYTVVLSQDEKQIDLSAWVTVDNHSGMAYPDARLRLIAGDVRIVRPGRGAGEARMMKLGALDTGVAEPQFEEQPFFEYHLYTLERPATLRDNETKQIELLSAHGVRGEKAYYYDGFQVPRDRYSDWDSYSIREDRNFGTSSSNKVAVMLSFRNTAENQLGMPLPKGKMRAYKRDEEGTPEFVGESSVDHTPSNEEVKLIIGDAFDLIGERVATFFEVDHDRRTCTETFQITLRNRKDTEVVIRVMEHMYRWMSWEITQKDYRFEQQDARTVRFDVRVPADAEKKIHYTVVYTW